MKRRKMYKPYIRRMNGKETATSIKTGVALEMAKELRPNGFVMVQRGFPNLVMMIGKTKKQLKNRPFTVQRKYKSFRQWARDIKRIASGL